VILEHSELDNAIIVAHQNNDGEALAALYKQAADINFKNGDIDAGCFLLTQAYVFALEWGLDIAGEIFANLKSMGREA